MAVARVVVNLSLDREFDYLIPSHLDGRVRVGSRVRVPFGKGKGTRVAFVVRVLPKSPYPELKELHSIEGEKEQIPDNLVKLAQWISQYYCCTREQAVGAMLPAVVRSGKISKKRQSYARLTDTDLTEILPDLEKKAKKQAAVMRILVRLHQVPLNRLLREADASHATVKALEKKGLLAVEKKVVERDPFADDVILPSTALDLTPHQQAAMDVVTRSIQEDLHEVILLHG